MSCSNCKHPKVHATGRCAACWKYLNRTGRERPERLARRAAERFMERLVEAEHERKRRLFDEGRS